MIKRKELTVFHMYSTSKNKSSLTDIMECLETESQKTSIPILMKQEKIKAGVLWNKTLDDCLLIIHPKHQDDYFSMVLQISRQGNYDFHRIYFRGKSNLFESSSRLESYISLRNMIVEYKPMNPIERQEKKIMDEECNWYLCVLENL